VSLPTAIDERGRLDRSIFSDADVYAAETTRIFGRAWLFLAHESMLPAPGDYLTTAMGADPVVVCRDDNAEIRAFLNSCTHRGNRVCLHDSGSTRTFHCSYHGWSFSTSGRLVGVPFVSEAYFDEFERDGLGLVNVPRVESHAGMVFGSWDPEAPPLVEYLGDMAWYMTHFLGAEPYGGLVPMGDRYGHRLQANWKIIAENNAGDHYHTLTTHGSLYRIGLRSKRQGFEGEQSPYGPFEVAVGDGHAIGGVETDHEMYEREVQQAASLGPEAVEWVKDRYQRFLAMCGDAPTRAYSFSHANVFPNFSFFGRGGALNGRLISVLHPRGPENTDIWQWFLVERDAPDVVKEYAWRNLGREGQLAAGMFAQDDSENFERVTESTRGPIARRQPFHLAMGLGLEGRWPGQEAWQTEGLRGVVGPRFSEHNQRHFYRAWDEMMTREGQ
jgi:phenylpropionate dioxygenase-like ring-hydroxylating dioxygenase large terminal subunit